MTDEEAWAVAQTLNTVDGYCFVCAEEAARDLAERLPGGYDWLALVRTVDAYSSEPVERPDPMPRLSA